MKFTYWLILAALFMYILPFFVFDDIEVFYSSYSFSGASLVERPYVVVTSIFMHASLVHLLSNVLVWVFFGASVESELGRNKTLLIFFLGAFAGHAASLVFYPWDAISVGASAGIFALVGVGMLVRPVDLSFYPLFVPLPLAFLGVLYALYNVYGFVTGADPNVSYVGHFGGLFVGLVFGFRHTGIKKGLKIILITLGIMILIPLVWFLLTR